MSKNDESIPSVINKTRTSEDVPLFTCGLKLDKSDYEEKVRLSEMTKIDSSISSVQIYLERMFRQFVDSLRVKRSRLPPEAQAQLASKGAPLEFYDNYLIDRQGDEIVSLNVGALQQGWQVPEFEQVYRIALPDSEQHASLQRARRPKPSCFNCGAFDHGVQGCPMKLDSERIRRSREQYQEQLAEACGYSDAAAMNVAGNAHETSRYHEDSYQSSLHDQVVIEERFRRYRPGDLSHELRQAMGLRENQLPMYIYNMRRCGYPPGWLKEARVKKSGLQVFHDNEEGRDDRENRIEVRKRSSRRNHRNEKIRTDRSDRARQRFSGSSARRKYANAGRSEQWRRFRIRFRQSGFFSWFQRARARGIRRRRVPEHDFARLRQTAEQRKSHRRNVSAEETVAETEINVGDVQTDADRRTERAETSETERNERDECTGDDDDERFRQLRTKERGTSLRHAAVDVDESAASEPTATIAQPRSISAGHLRSFAVRKFTFVFDGKCRKNRKWPRISPWVVSLFDHEREEENVIVLFV